MGEGLGPGLWVRVTSRSRKDSDAVSSQNKWWLTNATNLELSDNLPTV